MSWKFEEVNALKSLVGVYRLPEGCWAVFKVKERDVSGEERQALPEGIEYSWAILMPGESPMLRGDRMAGVDNADDATVRRKNQKDPTGPQHRAHKHKPDWKKTKVIGGQEWPLSGRGERLDFPPLSPGHLWLECMQCLEQLFEDLGIDIPTSEKLLGAKMTEESFRYLQKNTKVSI